MKIPSFEILLILFRFLLQLFVLLWYKIRKIVFWILRIFLIQFISIYFIQIKRRLNVSFFYLLQSIPSKKICDGNLLIIWGVLLWGFVERSVLINCIKWGSMAYFDLYKGLFFIICLKMLKGSLVVLINGNLPNTNR